MLSSAVLADLQGGPPRQLSSTMCLEMLHMDYTGHSLGHIGELRVFSGK